MARRRIVCRATAVAAAAGAGSVLMLLPASAGTAAPGTVAVRAAAAAVRQTPPAQAAFSYKCADAHLSYCLWYHPNEAGSRWGGTAAHTPVIAGRFSTSGAGQGQLVRNNAASINGGTGCNTTVYVYPNYQGPHQTVGPYGIANLNATLRNNEASIQETGTGCP